MLTSGEKFEESLLFDVQRVGSVGVTDNASLTINVNDKTPEVLFYKLDPVFESDIPVEKQEVIIDSEVLLGSMIECCQSELSGTFPVTVTSPTEFTYTVKNTPESLSYNSPESNISYNTTCENAYGPISGVDIKNFGSNYQSLPSILSVQSSFGSDAVLEVSSDIIGKINSMKIEDMGYNFPSDKTLSPTVALPQIIKIDPLYSIDSIEITSIGKGYTTSPNLIVIDNRTNEIISDLDLSYSLGDSEVSILKNTNGIGNLIPTIIPIRNSNGVGIGSISYDSVSKDVTVVLSSGFSSTDSFPFKVNDRVLIENISVGINFHRKRI